MKRLVVNEEIRVLMNEKTKINFIGKETGTIKIIETALRTKENYEISSNYLRDDSDSNVVNFCKADNSTIYILNLTDNWQQELSSIRENCNLDTNPILVFGPENTKAMREAIKMGAADYYSNPEQISELDEKLSTIVEELAVAKEKIVEEKPKLVTTVINTEGGAGASFISANIAHLFASQHNQHVALLDMDVQFGSHALNLDLSLKYGLSEVLDSVDKLDSSSLPGLFSKHGSGLHVLGEKLDEIVLPNDLSPERIEKLISLSSEQFDHTVIDLPRQIDAMFAATVAKSSRIILVMQQTLAHVRDTKRLLTILTQEFEVPKEHITVILNRFRPEHAITIKDIEATIDHRPLIILPNDYDRAVKAVEVAKPFVEFAPTTPLAKSFKEITQDLTGAPPEIEPKVTFFKRAVAAIVGN